MSDERCGVVRGPRERGEVDMRGPRVLAQTMSIATTRANGTRPWQYHSRSDNHSKLACWCLLFDLMLECDVVRSAAASGHIGFGINHVMVGAINKTLDLVVTVTPPQRSERPRRSFAAVGESYGVVLTADDHAALTGLPTLLEDRADDVSEVAIALEAKACMTDHIKSMPRFHAKLLATGYLAKSAAPRCIAVSYSLVNAAPTFATPNGLGRINQHSQPDDAHQVVRMLSTAVPTSRDWMQFGFDVVGVTVLDCRNDGTPVTIVDGAPGPSRADHVHYERMIRSLSSEFCSRFRL